MSEDGSRENQCYILARKIESKTAAVATDVIAFFFEDVPSRVLKTQTLDNGKEFNGHEEITALTGADI